MSTEIICRVPLLWVTHLYTENGTRSQPPNESVGTVGNFSVHDGFKLFDILIG